MNLSTRFSLTIPSEAAKKARTWEMKYLSSGFNFSQSLRSCEKTIKILMKQLGMGYLYLWAVTI